MKDKILRLCDLPQRREIEVGIYYRNATENLIIERCIFDYIDGMYGRLKMKRTGEVINISAYVPVQKLGDSYLIDECEP